MPRMPDTEARAILEEAFASRGQTPTLAELQAAQAVARFEGGYGGGWKDDGIGSHNWGAIQCGHTAPCEPGCFEYGDSHADGSGYRGCFRIYDSDVAGAAALLHELYRRADVPEAMVAGDATRVAEAMRATGYFEAPASSYAAAVEAHAGAIAEALGEPHLVVRGGGRVGGQPLPTLPPQPPPPTFPGLPTAPPTPPPPHPEVTRSRSSSDRIGTVVFIGGTLLAAATLLGRASS